MGCDDATAYMPKFKARMRALRIGNWLYFCHFLTVSHSVRVVATSLWQVWGATVSSDLLHLLDNFLWAGALEVDEHQKQRNHFQLTHAYTENAARSKRTRPSLFEGLNTKSRGSKQVELASSINPLNEVPVKSNTEASRVPFIKRSNSITVLTTFGKNAVEVSTTSIRHSRSMPLLGEVIKTLTASSSYLAPPSPRRSSSSSERRVKRVTAPLSARPWNDHSAQLTPRSSVFSESPLSVQPSAASSAVQTNAASSSAGVSVNSATPPANSLAGGCNFIGECTTSAGSRDTRNRWGPSSE